MPLEKRYGPITGDDLYRRLATGESMVVVDVRTAPEFQRAHIPGSMLIPLQELGARIDELPRNGVPIAAVCEVGVRSAHACNLLAQHGFGELLNLEPGLIAWTGPVNRGLDGNGNLRSGISPSSFLVENFHLLPRGLALDLQMGEGRNAIYLASRGFDVDGVERDPQAVAQARAAARKLGAPIRGLVGNIEDGTYILPIETYDVIVVFNYFHRPLFNDIKDGVVPGGVVVYQFQTVEQARFEGSAGTEPLLRSNELREVFADWQILRYSEFSGPARDGTSRAIARILARKPGR